MMRIAFLLGNGIDLGFQLNTSARTCVAEYVESQARTDDPNIRFLIEQITKTPETWADFELGFGDLTQAYEEKSPSLLEEAHYHFAAQLAAHLKAEEARFVESHDMEHLSQAFGRFLVGFPSHLTPTFRADIQKVLGSSSRDQRQYQVISFNYTSVVDRLVESLRREAKGIFQRRHGTRSVVDKLEAVVHPHGTVDEAMVVGVNDESQIASLVYRNDERILETLLKGRSCSASGHDGPSRALGLIASSQIVCVAGMSLGETDKDYWVKIGENLIRNPSSRLVIFHYARTGSSQTSARTASTQREVQDLFLARACIDEGQHLELRARIRVALFTDLFEEMANAAVPGDSKGRTGSA
jgi:hypothetical protein